MNPPNDFWNDRYRDETFAYGQEPNQWLVECLETLQVLEGKSFLFVAEGEGRNAVYAAQKGCKVSAFDPSEEGQKKALRFAEDRQVKINYSLSGYGNFTAPNAHFDAIVFIYAHMPSAYRQDEHLRLLKFLKTGGYVILEAFHPEQLGHDSGGPKDEDFLYSLETLKDDFRALKFLRLEKALVDLNEGPYHRGEAVVVRMLAQK